MNVNTFKNIVKTMWADNNLAPLFMQGPPGVGKSEICRQIVNEIDDMNWFHDLRIGDKDPSDVGGHFLPDVKTMTTIRTKPEWFPPEDAVGILLIDEFDHAPPSVQSVAYQIFNDHVIGGHVLPERIMVIAASNTAVDGGVHYRIARPIKNRVTMVKIEPCVSTWLQWAEENKINTLITSFITDSPMYLFYENTNDTLSTNSLGAFATGRSWEKVSDLCNTFKPNFLNIDSDIKELLAGTIGSAATAQFIEFAKHAQSSLSPLEIIKNNFSKVNHDDLKDRARCLYAVQSIIQHVMYDPALHKKTQLGILNFISQIEDTSVATILYTKVTEINKRMLTPVKSEKEANDIKKDILANVANLAF